MSKSTLSPLLELDSIRPIEVRNPSSAEDERAKAAFLELLLQEKLTHAVSLRGIEHDPLWKRDIAQLVSRAVPHLINMQGPSGLWLTQEVSVKLGTVKVEVDDYGVICAWIYEES